jgi:hypothetical protein
MAVRSAAASVNLDRIRIATPCPVSWDQMTGDNRVRFCDSCQLNVYNISELTQGEAVKLLLSTEGRLCARIYRRSDGTVLTKDCPVGLHALRLRLSKKTAALFAAVVSLAGAALGQQPAAKDGKTACTPQTRVTLAETSPDQTQVITGTARDPAGGGIPGATITVINEATKEEKVTAADEAGKFKFDSLSPGSYRVRIQARDFMTSEITNLVLEKGQTVDLDTIVQLTGQALSGIVDNSSTFQIPLPTPGTTIFSGELLRRLPIPK